MSSDRDGNIWVGTAQGLLRVSPQGTVAKLRNTESIGTVSSIFEDRRRRPLGWREAAESPRLRDGHLFYLLRQGRSTLEQQRSYLRRLHRQNLVRPHRRWSLLDTGWQGFPGCRGWSQQRRHLLDRRHQTASSGSGGNGVASPISHTIKSTNRRAHLYPPGRSRPGQCVHRPSQAATELSGPEP